MVWVSMGEPEYPIANAVVFDLSSQTSLLPSIVVKSQDVPIAVSGKFSYVRFNSNNITGASTDCPAFTYTSN